MKILVLYDAALPLPRDYGAPAAVAFLYRAQHMAFTPDIGVFVQSNKHLFKSNKFELFFAYLISVYIMYLLLILLC
jgi:hypothetical protein